MIKTGEGLITDDLCDQMGHFTTRYYTAAFDEASYELVKNCGLPLDQKNGFVDLELNMKFLGEIREGERFYIKSAFIRLGNSSFTAIHHMYNAADDSLVAEAEEKAVVFDLEKRKSKPMPEDFKKLAGKFLVD